MTQLRTSHISVRKAIKQDAHVLFDMILGLARHHQAESNFKSSIDTLTAHGSGQEPKFHALIAEYKGEPAGFVSFTINYSIWLGKNYLHIDDVFTYESYRGKGVGEALLKATRAYCLEKGLDRVKWEVEADNAGAIRFYERLGAVLKVKGIFSWEVN